MSKKEKEVLETVLEEVTEETETKEEETTEKTSKSKTPIIIGALVVVGAIVALLVFLLGGVGENEVKIDGKTYSYSAKEGIKDLEKICDGVVVVNGWDGIYYPSGSDTTETIDMTNLFSGEYPIVYGGYYNYRNGIDMGCSNFTVYGDFETHEGITKTSSQKDIEKAGYMPQINTDSLYSEFITEDGCIDWDEIEKDYEKIISNNSFDGIEYIETAGKVGADAFVIFVSGDDVQGLVDFFENSSSDGKKAMMRWLAFGKLSYMLTQGEIDYFVEEVILMNNGNNLLAISVFGSQETVLQREENWGISR